MLKNITKTIICMAILPLAAQAEIRTYQPQTSSPSPAQPVMSKPAVGVPAAAAAQPAATPDAASRRDIMARWNQEILDEQRRLHGDDSLVVYLYQNDIGQNVLDQVKHLQELPEVRKLGLTPYFMESDVGADNVLEYFKKNPQLETLDVDDVHLDLDNDYARANGLTRTSIVYRDPSGAIRIYGLVYEMDKLQRQLQRQIETPQTPAQP